eukprot:TRINITY_DN33836_c0_g1_i1.p1 TRINITY_DN33836_c0_g1~~TRINITY_DN33836_c0_g1_i1.p1  ORF type:complete len:342 (+),score=90.90 TRINITY_DN33836_c0_g1_i1:110-1135(+)
MEQLAGQGLRVGSEVRVYSTSAKQTVPAVVIGFPSEGMVRVEYEANGNVCQKNMALESPNLLRLQRSSAAGRNHAADDVTPSKETARSSLRQQQQAMPPTKSSMGQGGYDCGGGDVPRCSGAPRRSEAGMQSSKQSGYGADGLRGASTAMPGRRISEAIMREPEQSTYQRLPSTGELGHPPMMMLEDDLPGGQPQMGMRASNTSQCAARPSASVVYNRESIMSSGMRQSRTFQQAERLCGSTPQQQTQKKSQHVSFAAEQAVDTYWDDADKEERASIRHRRTHTPFNFNPPAASDEEEDELDDTDARQTVKEGLVEALRAGTLAGDVKNCQAPSSRLSSRY